MFDDKVAKTKKRSGLFGDYEEHYDKQGRKIGETRKRSGLFGDYEEHYDKSGRKVGKSQEHSGLLGDYKDHYNNSGEKIGKTKTRSGLLGDYEEHYDKKGKKVGTSKERNGVLGEYKDHKKDDGGCFLTTACTAYNGLPDDCYQLNTLRRFRDNYLLSIDEGSEDVQDYYEFAPDLVESIQVLPEEMQEEMYSYIFASITQCVSLIENEENEKCHTAYKNMVLHIREVLHAYQLVK